MFTLDFIKKAEIVEKIIENFNSSNLIDLKNEMDSYREKHLSFIKEHFHKNRDKEEANISIEEIKELNPINNKFFKKYYKPIVKSNTNLDNIVKDLLPEDLEILQLDKFINISKKIEEIIFDIEDDESFKSEIITKLMNSINEYMNIYNNILYTQKIYTNLHNSKIKTPEHFKSLELTFYVQSYKIENFFLRIQALKELYETALKLNGLKDESQNKLILLKVEKDLDEYYKIAGTTQVINDVHFFILGWVRYFAGNASEKNDAMHNIQTKLRNLIEQNRLNAETGSKYVERIKKALKELDIEDCLSIEIDIEKITLGDNKNIMSRTKILEVTTIDPKTVENKVLMESSGKTDEMSDMDLLRKGIDLLSIKRYKDGISYFDRAIKLNPQFAEAYNFKASAYIQLSEFMEALKWLEKAIDLDPNYRDAYLNKGTAFFSMAKYNDALEFYKKTIELDPKYSEGYFNIGSCFMMLENKKTEAIQAFSKAIELSPYYAGAYYNRACAYISEKDTENCLKDLEQAVKIDKTFKQMLKFDSDFAPIQNYPKFKSIVA